MVRLADSYRGTDRHMLLQVHDEILTELPIEELQNETYASVLDILENPRVSLRVPVRWNTGVSTKDWQQAADKKKGRVNVGRHSRAHICAQAQSHPLQPQ